MTRNQEDKDKKGWMAAVQKNQPVGVSHKFRIAGDAHVGRPGSKELRPTVIPDDPGMVSSGLRRQLVERLAARGIRDPQVLHAMLAVPRHFFVEPGLASRAYEDVALPIGHAQTISQPFIVARMAELAMNGRSRLKRVLEIGTGCGYQAAVLSCLAEKVVSIERIKALHELARNNLQVAGIRQVRLIYGDGVQGWVAEQPYDAIVVAAAGLEIAPAWLEQLAIGGRLVAPLASIKSAATTGQRLVVVERTASQDWQRQDLDAVNFVPLLGGIQ
ncbi:MAG: protein-L-isoaspartate(D-aspartate) O-methyltransferase [Burkholderiales bacterium]